MEHIEVGLHVVVIVLFYYTIEVFKFLSIKNHLYENLVKHFTETKLAQIITSKSNKTCSAGLVRLTVLAARMSIINFCGIFTNFVLISLLVCGVLRTLPRFFVYGDCTRNHTVLKYNSLGGQFLTKKLIVPGGNFSNYFMEKKNLLINCIVRKQQL